MYRLPYGLPADRRYGRQPGDGGHRQHLPPGGRLRPEGVYHPARTVTGTVRVTGGLLPVVSVRTAGEVPKEKVLDVARALCRVHLTAPVQAGDVVIPDVLGTGVDVVATRSVYSYRKRASAGACGCSF